MRSVTAPERLFLASHLVEPFDLQVFSSFFCCSTPDPRNPHKTKRQETIFRRLASPSSCLKRQNVGSFTFKKQTKQQKLQHGPAFVGPSETPLRAKAFQTTKPTNLQQRPAESLFRHCRNQSRSKAKLVNLTNSNKHKQKNKIETSELENL